MIPWASALYACDYSWWKVNESLWRSFEGYKFTWSEVAAKRFDLIYTHGKKGKGLGREYLHAGGSSGYMAINLAWFLGASSICLLGFDMQYTNGQCHWHGNHRKTSNPPPNKIRKWIGKFVPLYEDLKSEGVELVNCTRETALTIPWKPLEECLK